MKKLVVNLAKSTLVARLVLGTSNIYAVGDVKVAPISGSKKARVYVTPAQNENVKLKVLNEKGTEFLYSEELSDASSYNKIYDFNQLNEGTYKIVAESSSKIVETNITVSKEGIKVVGENEQYKPFFKLQDNKLIVSYLNDKNNQVSVNFSDGKEIFFTSKKVQDLNFMKAYDLSNLEKGAYLVSVNSGKDSYSYYFQVK